MTALLFSFFHILKNKYIYIEKSGYLSLVWVANKTMRNLPTPQIEMLSSWAVISTTEVSSLDLNHVAVKCIIPSDLFQFTSGARFVVYS